MRRIWTDWNLPKSSTQHDKSRFRTAFGLLHPAAALGAPSGDKERRVLAGTGTGR